LPQLRYTEHGGSVMAAEHWSRSRVSQRWRKSPCGIGPTQRDLYSAFLTAYLDPADPSPSRAKPRYIACWEGWKPGLGAACERLFQRASAGQSLPRSFGIPKGGARLLGSLSVSLQEPPALLRQSGM